MTQHLPDTATAGAPPGVAYPKTIKSFVRRAGRTTAAQARAFEHLGPQLLLPYRESTLEPVAVFGRSAPLILEIGFGMGEATAHIAEQGQTNIRIVQHDAVEVLEHMIAPGSLAGVHIFFPDPWHKKKHNKRRLIQPALVARLASRLAPGGYLHCATDWQPYAEQMLQVLSAEPLLTNTVPDYAPQPAYRPLTKFENRGLKLGHGVWDLIFLRRA